MPYELLFTAPPEIAPDRAAFERYFTRRERYTVERGHAAYHNDDTGVTFTFDYVGSRAGDRREWARFVLEGPGESTVDWENVDWSNPPAEILEHAASFQMQDATLVGLLDGYAEVAAATDALVETVDLDTDHELPAAPWNPPGTRWSARRVFLHIVAETAQHAGHADIIRESIDGQKSMG